MDTSTVLVIAVGAVVVLAALFLFTSSARRDRAAATGGLTRETRKRDRGRDAAPGLPDGDEGPSGRAVERAAVLERRQAGVAMVPASPAPPPAPVVADEATIGVSRRAFLNRGIVGAFVLGLSGFGASTIAFLWPTLTGGFGSKIKIGKVDDIKANIQANRGFYYFAEGRLYMTEYPTDALAKARKIYSGGVLAGMEEGLVALYQKCVHLGCRVPECASSQWFECPCHGSKYNQVGEKKAGPAPRGMDRFGIVVSGGVVNVDTSQVIQGPPIGTNTTGQEAEGPFCA
ncbi:MAG TPA: Rieske 2Fe-2S domain-containing protein [Acidimicrobiales bacterium]|nr:Rieske 2Fe-2S domain-containing protein [Acidimicrobiales bacterium]